MIVDRDDLTEALARLELEGGDCLEIEAKTFSEYSHAALGPTLSAFANLPGGGTILLGVSEKPVSVVGVEHPRDLKQALVSQARQGFSSEIAVDVYDFDLDGKTVVVANVQEAPVNGKPCRWKETGWAYLRQYDGDYRMSLQEEQQLLLRHERPREDSAPVPGTSAGSLDDGHGRDVHEYPLVAVRELIANALVHRDLSEPALSKGIEIRLLRDRMIISNPGGLWGLSVDQLGTRDGKSAVNEYLYNICTFATDGEGRRVIEGLGSGIREVRRALHDADMEPVRFQDTGVRFTALLPRGALLSPRPDTTSTVPDEVAALSRNAAAVWLCLEDGARTRQQIVEAAHLTARQTAYALSRLKRAGLIVVRGGRGDTATSYARA